MGRQRRGCSALAGDRRRHPADPVPAPPGRGSRHQDTFRPAHPGRSDPLRDHGAQPRHGPGQRPRRAADRRPHPGRRHRAHARARHRPRDGHAVRARGPHRALRRQRVQSNRDSTVVHRRPRGQRIRWTAAHDHARPGVHPRERLDPHHLGAAALPPVPAGGLRDVGLRRQQCDRHERPGVRSLRVLHERHSRARPAARGVELHGDDQGLGTAERAHEHRQGRQGRGRGAPRHQRRPRGGPGHE